MSAGKCYLLTDTDGGSIPADYPLQLGAICRAVNGRLADNVWNAAECNWVSLIWAACADPSKTAALK